MVPAVTVQTQRLQLDAAGPNLIHIMFAREFCSFDSDCQHLKIKSMGLAVRWLRHCASTAGGTGSIPSQGAKILCAAQRGQKIEKKLRACT